MILYVEKPKDFTRTLLELINEFSKFHDTKINIHKPAAFLYTNNEIQKKISKENKSLL